MMEHPCPPYIRMRSLLAHALKCRATRKAGKGRKSGLWIRRKMATRGDRDHAKGGGGHSFHAVRPDVFNYVWDNSIEPELEIDPGEVLEFRVRDASDEQIRADSTSEDVAKLDFDHVNPVSG